jgi:hypothetical protein
MISLGNIASKTRLAASLGVLACVMPLLCAAQMNAPITGQMDPGPSAHVYSQPVSSAYAPPASSSGMEVVPETAVQPIITTTPTYQTQTVAPSSTRVAAAEAPPVQTNARPVRPSRRLGTETRALLDAQADGLAAGPELPILGPVASASWKRYVNSFGHPIPEWFAVKVGSGSGSPGGSGN